MFQVWYTFGDIALAYLLGLNLSLLLESPVLGLEKYIFQTGKFSLCCNSAKQVAGLNFPFVSSKLVLSVL